MNIKVLPLKKWMMFKFDGGNLTETLPVFNRDGWYAIGKTSWFEVDGNAFLYDFSIFENTLKRYNHRPLRQCESEALDILHKGKLLSKEMLELYNADKFYFLHRTIKRSTRLMITKMKTF